MSCTQTERFTDAQNVSTSTPLLAAQQPSSDIWAQMIKVIQPAITQAKAQTVTQSPTQLVTSPQDQAQALATLAALGAPPVSVPQKEKIRWYVWVILSVVLLILASIVVVVTSRIIRAASSK